MRDALNDSERAFRALHLVNPPAELVERRHASRPPPAPPPPAPPPRGPGHVHAVDVGRGLLAWSLRNDPRVTVWENVNARRLDGGTLEPVPTLLVVDVSCINLGKILEPLVPTLTALEEIIALVKPQFEAPRDRVEPGGVVRDAGVHDDVITKNVRLFDELAFAAVDVAASPLRGPAGNREFFLRGVRGAEGRDLAVEIAAVVASEKP